MMRTGAKYPSRPKKKTERKKKLAIQNAKPNTGICLDVLQKTYLCRCVACYTSLLNPLELLSTVTQSMEIQPEDANGKSHYPLRATRNPAQTPKAQAPTFDTSQSLPAPPLPAPKLVYQESLKKTCHPNESWRPPMQSTKNHAWRGAELRSSRV